MNELIAIMLVLFGISLYAYFKLEKWLDPDFQNEKSPKPDAAGGDTPPGDHDLKIFMSAGEYLEYKQKQSAK